jgi:hypothetical protein
MVLVPPRFYDLAIPASLPTITTALVLLGLVWKNIHHRGTEFAEFGYLLIKNSLLRALRASAVQSPSVASPQTGIALARLPTQKSEDPPSYVAISP